MITHPTRGRSRKTVPVLKDPVYDHERDYAAFRLNVQAAFESSAGPLFETDADGLYDTYLDTLPSDRPSHMCTACRRFINAFGGLVRVGDDGGTEPVMWPADWKYPVPAFYEPVARALRAKVAASRIVRPFLSSSATLGVPVTGEWEHFAVCTAPVFSHPLLTPGQAAAAKRMDFLTVQDALRDFPAVVLDEALRLLTGGHLERSERFIAPVRWLRDLQDRPKGLFGQNLLWRAVAMAPDGFCHPRAGVVGTLLEDIKEGVPFPAIKARFDAKVGGLAYQRPQAAPTAGAIAAAEAIFEKMGLAPALERRFARLDECVTVWKPTPTTPSTREGVFGHLMPKGTSAPSVEVPQVTMTWTKFMATVMPTAQEIEFMVPGHGHFTALLAATNPDAPPILKWDDLERRNTVSHYVYHGGSPAFQWRLLGSAWTRVTGIVPSAATWGENPKAYLGQAFVLTLEGAVDTRTDSGNALFPEVLRGEVYPVRSVIEAYSRTAQIGGREQASACGYAVGTGVIGIILRATSAGKTARYMIDRWD